MITLLFLLNLVTSNIYYFYFCMTKIIFKLHLQYSNTNQFCCMSIDTITNIINTQTLR